MEIRCPVCHAALRVADEHVGRQARCPKCGNIQTVGDSAGEAVAAAHVTDGRTTVAGGRSSGTVVAAPPGSDSFRLAREQPPSGGPDLDARFRQSIQRQHRGELIILVAIAGLAMSCPVLSIAAWVMGSNDLRRIRAGQVNPEGTTLTRWGYYIGLCSSLLWITVAFCVTFILLLFSGN